MKILVTGGAGYIGSILCEYLIANHHQVTVLDNFMYGQFPLAHLAHKLKIINADVRRQSPEFYTPYEAIIPLAAIVGAPACDRDPCTALETNWQVHKWLTNNLSKEQLVIYPNTNSGYGIAKTGKPCTEESTLTPISAYGRQKVDAEKIWMQRENSISLRLATVFGMSPRMRLDLLVNDLVHRAMFDKAVMVFEGRAMRNYVHIRDVAFAFVHCLVNFSKMKGQVYNVGDTKANMSKLGLCKLIHEHIPFSYREDNYHNDPDKRDYIVSNAKIEATGWEPEFSLADGIKELINGYQMIGRRPFSNV